MTETAAQRISGIVLLLRSSNDHYNGPKGLRLAAQPGPAPNGKVPCSCARVVQASFGANWVGCEDCPLCGGSGFRGSLAALDLPNEDSDSKGHVYDAYTYGADRSGKQKPMLALKRVEEQEERFPWERRHKAYEQLRRAMEALYQCDYIAHQILERAYVQGRYGFDEHGPLLGPTWAAAAKRGLKFLETRMPRPLRLPSELQERLEADERTKAVLQARANGKSLTQIGRESGRSRRAVARSERRLSA